MQLKPRTARFLPFIANSIIASSSKRQPILCTYRSLNQRSTANSHTSTPHDSRENRSKTRPLNANFPADSCQSPSSHTHRGKTGLASTHTEFRSPRVECRLQQSASLAVKGKRRSFVCRMTRFPSSARCCCSHDKVPIERMRSLFFQSVSPHTVFFGPVR